MGASARRLVFARIAEIVFVIGQRLHVGGFKRASAFAVLDARVGPHVSDLLNLPPCNQVVKGSRTRPLRQRESRATSPLYIRA
jgi:hypothetical protein